MPIGAFFRDAGAHDGASTPGAQAPATRKMTWGPGTEPVAPEDVPGPNPLSSGAGRTHRYVVRRNDRASLDIESAVRWERLTAGPLAELEFLELRYGPGSESNAALYRHPGRELVLVLSGRLQICIGFERDDLGPGDSIDFPFSFPHRYVNATENEVRAVTMRGVSTR